MTVQADPNFDAYTGNGVTTAFATSFAFRTGSHIKVYVDSALQTITTDYTISGGNGSTGTITFLTAPTSGDSVILHRVLPLEQSTDFSNFTGNPSDVTETQLDDMVMQIQQVKDETDRSVRLPITSPSVGEISVYLPEPSAGKALKWNDDGDGLVNSDLEIDSPLSVQSELQDLVDSATASATAAAASAVEAAADAALLPSISISDAGKVLLVNGGGTAFIAQTYAPADASITYAKIQNVSATSRLLGRKTSGAGVTEELTLSEVLDFVGSAAQGDILYRGASSWARLAAGTADTFFKTGGAGANPSWSVIQSASNTVAGIIECATAAEVQLGSSSTLAVTPNSLMNGIGFSRQETTPAISTVSATYDTYNHALGLQPKFWIAFVICTAADLNYSVNDEVSIDTGVFVSYDANNLFTTVTAANLQIPDKTTHTLSNIDNAKWDLYVRFWV